MKPTPSPEALAWARKRLNLIVLKAIYDSLPVAAQVKCADEYEALQNNDEGIDALLKSLRHHWSRDTGSTPPGTTA
jgi:hypothetical protein